MAKAKGAPTVAFMDAQSELLKSTGALSFVNKDWLSGPWARHAALSVANELSDFEHASKEVKNRAAYNASQPPGKQSPNMFDLAYIEAKDRCLDQLGKWLIAVNPGNKDWVEKFADTVVETLGEKAAGGSIERGHFSVSPLLWAGLTRRAVNNVGRDYTETPLIKVPNVKGLVGFSALTSIRTDEVLGYFEQQPGA